MVGQLCARTQQFEALVAPTSNLELNLAAGHWMAGMPKGHQWAGYPATSHGGKNDSALGRAHRVEAESDTGLSHTLLALNIRAHRRGTTRPSR